MHKDAVARPSAAAMVLLAESRLRELKSTTSTSVTDAEGSAVTTQEKEDEDVITTAALRQEVFMLRKENERLALQVSKFAASQH